MAYDPLQPDAYTEHLGEVNRSNEVLLSEDIRNSKGVLIAKKGEVMSPGVVEKIIQFKLLKPLEESIEVADSLNASRALLHMRRQLGDLSEAGFHKQYEVDAEVERGMIMLARYPILLQKISVLQIRLPNEFKKAALVAWFALILGKKMQLSEADRDCLFIAALGHDIGMLHIDRRITEKQSALSPEEWRTLQGHVAISYSIFNKTDSMQPNISRAVLEHHETADGTGYLSGKQGAEMSPMGRLLSVVDSMCAVLLKLRAAGRSPRDLIPILRINGYVHDHNVCATFIQLLTEHKWREKALLDDSSIESFAEKMVADRDCFDQFAQQASLALDAIPTNTVERNSVKAARLVHGHLTSIIRSSGVLDAGYVSWLQSIVRDKQHEYYRELEDTRLMLDEVRWQLIKLTRLLSAVEQDKHALSAEQRDRFLVLLNSLPKFEQSK